MNAILRAAVELQDFLHQHKWSFCFIGGIAVLRWGKPRATQDVDASLFVTAGKERETIDAVLKRFPARVSNADQFAIESRVILAQSTDGVAYDIALAQFDFEKKIIDRATFFYFSNDANLLTISAEDLVVMKSFADRDQDWIDVQGIIDANDQLDVRFIRLQLEQLVDLQPESRALQKFENLLG